MKFYQRLIEIMDRGKINYNIHKKKIYFFIYFNDYF